MPVLRPSRRQALALGATLLSAPRLLRAQPARWPMTVTDSAGRQVTLPRAPRAILLASGFQLIPMALVHPDPVSLLSGWVPDLTRLNPAMTESFAARFPRIRDLPTLGLSGVSDVSLEKALTMAPDLVLFAGWHTEPAGLALMDKLAEAGIPSLVVDFFRDPMRNTAPSMRLLGRILEREEQGEAFASFYEARLERVRQGVASASQAGPPTLLHALAGGRDCCWVAGATGVGSFLNFAGGHNLGADRFPGRGGGQLNLEYVLAEDPHTYIATGRPIGPGFVIGPGVTVEEARASLAAAVALPGFADLAAVREKRVHGLWNFFNALPLHILAVEAMARWTRPSIFPNLDPADTLAEINQRFAAVPFEGTYWVSLEGPV